MQTNLGYEPEYNVSFEKIYKPGLMEHEMVAIRSSAIEAVSNLMATRSLICGDVFSNVVRQAVHLFFDHRFHFSYIISLTVIICTIILLKNTKAFNILGAGLATFTSFALFTKVWTHYACSVKVAERMMEASASINAGCRDVLVEHVYNQNLLFFEIAALMILSHLIIKFYTGRLGSLGRLISILSLLFSLAGVTIGMTHIATPDSVLGGIGMLTLLKLNSGLIACFYLGLFAFYAKSYGALIRQRYNDRSYVYIKPDGRCMISVRIK